MKKILLFAVAIAFITQLSSQEKYKSISLNIDTKDIHGTIDPKIYGQLLEHIFHSVNGGLWGEMIMQRSFEPERYVEGIISGGFVDGWHAEDGVLYSPAVFSESIPLQNVQEQDYEITMNIKWRSYHLPVHLWSGGYADMRFAFKSQDNGKSYALRVHDPRYETGTTLGVNVGKNISKIPIFSIEKETVTERIDRNGNIINHVEWVPIYSIPAKYEKLIASERWHKLEISCKSTNTKIFWDDEKIFDIKGLENSGMNNIFLLVDNTEASYKKIKVASPKGKGYFEGMPSHVSPPLVAPGWSSLGNGEFGLVTDARNMEFSQKVNAKKSIAGVKQGPKNVKKEEIFKGSIWAKGDGEAMLSVALKSDDKVISEQRLGQPDDQWKKYNFTFNVGNFEGDADFTVNVKGGAVLVDQVSMFSKSALEMGGFRPDLYEAVNEIHPTCFRWPGGGYATKYQWKWGIGEQEERIRMPHLMWSDYDQNAFGTDEFLQLCNKSDIEPIIVVRIGFDKTESEKSEILREAQDWVAYCNQPASGKWGKIRAENGHPEPYSVKFWEIDNEVGIRIG